jgi:3-hydroxy acid dehydrogenase/malonic semialdehyde reductase
VCDAAAVAQAVGELELDVLVANAGMALGTASLQEGDPAAWSQVIDTNVKGVLNTIRPALPRMIERGSGDVVLLGSVAGRQVYPGGNVYCATKFAVQAIYEALRLDVAGKGLRFTNIEPAMVETDFSVVRFRGDEDRASAVYEGMTPLSPADVADAILYAVTRPAHVNVGEIVLWPTDQASTTIVRRDP